MQGSTGVIGPEGPTGPTGVKVCSENNVKNKILETVSRVLFSLNIRASKVTR